MSNDAEIAQLHAEIDSLKINMDAMTARIESQERTIKSMMAEITKIKKYEWGIIESPPIIDAF